MTKTNMTPELISAALAHIPASLPRDDWARMAMAIKSEFPDATHQTPIVRFHLYVPVPQG